jgi:hypothetical protein
MIAPKIIIERADDGGGLLTESGHDVTPFW